jgi:hypothetical protein
MRHQRFAERLKQFAIHGVALRLVFRMLLSADAKPGASAIRIASIVPSSATRLCLASNL